MKTLIQAIVLLFSLSSLAFAADTGLNQSVDINKASAEQLARTLDGVGMRKAQAIVEYRRVHGAFKSAESLTAVKGIGENTVKVNKQKIRIK